MTVTLVDLEQSNILTGHDRCDKCGSQAYVLVEGPSGTLLFCGHHYAVNEKKLIGWAMNVIDERSKLL